MSHVRRRFIVENTWVCDSCQTKNRGRDTVCKSCGSPKEKLEKDVVPDPATVPEVTDPDRLREAHAGVNWICSFCESQNRKLSDKCPRCGADRQGDSDEVEGHAPRSQPAFIDDDSGPAAPHPSQAMFDEMTAMHVFDESKVVPANPFPRERRRSGSNVPKRTPFIILGVSFAVAALVALLLWVFIPKKVEATVSETQWVHRSELMERLPVHDEGWRSGMPIGAYDTSCHNKYKGTEDCNPHDCNCHDESYDCNPHSCNCRTNCHDLGNGYSECDEVCDTCYDTCSRTECDTCYDQCDVYEDWCSYTYDTWPVIQTEVTGGDTHETYWPELAAKGSDQRLRQTAVYTITFIHEDEVWEYEAKNLAEYKQYSQGEQWTIKVNRARQIWPQEQLGS